MTAIHFMSDLHLDCEKRFMDAHCAPPDTDIVILAGDTHPGVLGVMWAAERFPGLPVVYLPGNHEYYGKRGFSRHLERMRDKAAEQGGNVLVSDRNAHVIAGTRLVCATLWTDYNLYGNPRQAMLDARAMNDYSRITVVGGRLLGPNTLLSEHTQSMDYLRETLTEPFPGPTVVVTHHAPSPLSMPPDFAGDPVSPCYASDLSGFIDEFRPDIWIHGHIHTSHDYLMPGGTRILSNPRGYASAHRVPGHPPITENTAFKSDMIIRLSVLKNEYSS